MTARDGGADSYHLLATASPELSIYTDRHRAEPRRTPPAAPQIRPAHTDDLPHVAALLGEAGLSLAGVAEAWRIWIAVDARGGAVGSAALERHARHPDTGDHDAAYLLRSVAVRADQRGSGLGSRLVCTALDAVPPGASVALGTETAYGWFPRFGFVAVDRDRLDPALAASPRSP